ncbi:MAG TPA: DUF4388 domain-containing protein [Pyrinomonadaceae bacterium]|nr:DUF4388 domain-containing protein [Pyrinomonadaceae bacterium]
MYNSRFVILTGHLNDYPISDLVGILRHQRKTGRLLIEYDKGPAQFFFYEGELVDAKMNELTGLHAVCFALAQPQASFNFNPLIQPTQRTIEDSLQRTVSELFGCWDETTVEIPVGAIDVPILPEKTAEPVPSPPAAALPAYEIERLALPAAVVSSNRRPVSLFVMTAAGLATLGVSTAIALSGGFRNSQLKNGAQSVVERSTKSPVVAPASDSQHPAAAKSATESSSTRSRSRLNSETSSQSTRMSEKNNERANTEVVEGPKPSNVRESSSKSDPESVTVVMEIENGRVLSASIANPKPGLDSYEALALRIARQRRYSSQQNGRETVKIKVSPSDQ